MGEGRGGEGNSSGVEEYVEQLTSSLEEYARRLETEPDETKRMLKLVAWINTWLERHGLGRVIVTEGFAVEVYTGRVYRTMDVDIVVDDGPRAARIVERALARMGERIGRGYLLRRAVLAVKSIDIVSSTYSRRTPPVKLVVDNLHVYLDPPEELIVTYLASWKYWGSEEDRDKALWLYTAWQKRLDHNYLERRAREERVEDKLEEVKELAKLAT